MNQFIRQNIGQLNNSSSNNPDKGWITIAAGATHGELRRSTNPELGWIIYLKLNMSDLFLLS